MTRLLPIDLHAHIEPAIPAPDLVGLRSLIFAATRSLDEAELAEGRSDDWTIWGVGCHPGLVGAQRAFISERFEQLITQTACVSEVGLDEKSRVPMRLQLRTFDTVLHILQSSPRITSIHSVGATDRVVHALEARPIQGAVLHWWLGNYDQTIRALELGCYFSVNLSSIRRRGILDLIPSDRILAETDHPFGDRHGGADRRPGRVSDVEAALAKHYGVEADTIRTQTWQNLRDLSTVTRAAGLLPRPVRVALAALV